MSFEATERDSLTAPIDTGASMPKRPDGPRVVVVGDLLVDVVIAPTTELATGTDVPGRVMLRQGGSATTTARWLGRSGAQVSLIASVGRDAAGRALVETIRRDGVMPQVVRVAGRATGRVGVVVSVGGERSFVQDRGATLCLAPEHLREEWFVGAELVHLPAYSLLGHPLGDAGKRAAELAHAAGALVTVDLSSSAPLLALGRDAARDIVRGAKPDLLFAAGDEARALADSDDGLLDIAPVVVFKRGPEGATVLYRERSSVQRLDVAARAVAAADTTGAGDAFDAGFILGWLAARKAGASTAVGLRRGALVGHRLATRQLLAPRRELAFG
jgi:sugar/nucleoside kinase (ribokinase family)